MGRTEPIGWHELDEETQERTVRILRSQSRVSREEARDAVSGAAMRLIARKVIPRNVESLLLTTAQHVLIDEQRRRQRERQHYGVAYSLDEPNAPSVAERGTPYTAEPGTRLAAAEQVARQLQRMWGTLKQLPERDRLILTAYYFEDRGPSAIDGLLGLAPGTSKARIHRARERLRGVLSGSNGRDEHNP